MVNYNEFQADFYEQVLDQRNILRSWFHNSRNKKIHEYVLKYYKRKNVIADLGCGNVLWNKTGLPVIGVDVNENFLDYNLTSGKIIQKAVCSLDDIKLPDQSVDIVIISEVIEHLPRLNEHIKEISRIVKAGGYIISSVPYDTFFSLWKPLFAVQCFYRGNILGEKYYQERCGHINNFSKKSISQLFLDNNFKIIEQHNHCYFTIFTIVQKI